MKIDEEEDMIIFESTGRKVYAHYGIIGISPNLSINEGYDGGIEDNDFTQEERLELARHMVNLWTLYGQ